MNNRLFYHDSKGIKWAPEVMSTIHLRNAVKKLQETKQTEEAIYPLLVEELRKRESNDEKTGE